MDSTWVIPYRRERDQFLLARLRWCAILSLLGSLVLAVQVGVRPGAGRAYAPYILGYAMVSLTTWMACRLRVVRTRVTVLALTYVVALIAVMALQYVAIPSDANGADVGFVAALLGVTVLLPWGFAPQLTVAGAAVAAFLWVIVRVGINPSGAISVVLTVAVVSVVAARLIDRYRATLFERAWQQEHLLSLARALAARTSMEDIIRGVLDYGLRLVAADLAVVTLRDPARSVYRTEAIEGPAADEGQWFIGVEIPTDFPGIQQIVERDTFVLPDDAPTHPIQQLVTQNGYRSVIYAAMRYEGDVIGIVSFVRKGPVPFTAGDRMLVRGIADQAAVALRTARLIDDLRRANHMKSEFLSTMSHELRTPLNVILGYAEMVAQPAPDAVDRQGMLERIQSAGRELLELIDNTLEIGKLDAGRSEVRLERVWLPEFFGRLQRGCAQIPRAREVALEWSSAVPDVAIRTDQRKLTVALRNLVGNALKFTEHGWVRVEATVADGHVVIRVADTGIGITPEDQPRIFEMFRQGDGSNTRRFSGAGLGLYLVRQFADQLGASLRLESTPGRGTVFMLALPLDRASAPPRAAQSAPAASHSQTPRFEGERHARSA